MNEIIFKTIYMILYIAAAIGRAPYAKKVRKMKVKVKEKSILEIFIIISAIPFMVLPLIYIFSDLIDNFNITLPIPIRVIGAVGFLAAISLHNLAHKALGTNWSYTLELKKNQKLITKGPYKHIRHPMYTAFLLWVIFQSLLLPNLLILVTGLAAFIMMYAGRIKKEEEMMIKNFGKQYKDYMKRTGRLFPRF